MQLFSKSGKSTGEAGLPEDRLSYLIDKLGIGGSNPMNITWADLANVLVFLLEAEARRVDEAKGKGTLDKERADRRSQR